MFSSKKSGIMRHPYATLAIIGLATAGVITIGAKVKGMVSDKMLPIGLMMKKGQSGPRDN